MTKEQRIDAMKELTKDLDEEALLEVIRELQEIYRSRVVLPDYNS